MDLLGSARCRKGKQQVIRWIILFEAKSRKKNIFWVHEDRDEVAGADQNNKWGHGKGWWPRACQLATWGSFCRPGRMTGHWPNSRALLSLIKVGEECGAAVIIFILLVSSSTASTALLPSSLITFSNFPKFCLQGLLGISPCCHRSGTLSVTVSGQLDIGLLALCTTKTVSVHTKFGYGAILWVFFFFSVVIKGYLHSWCISGGFLCLCAWLRECVGWGILGSGSVWSVVQMGFWCGSGK